MSDPQEEFRALVLRYIELTDKLNEAGKLRKEKTDIGKKILSFMKANEIAQCNLRDGGKLVVKTSKSATPIKKDYVLEQLASRLGNRDTATQLTTYLWSNRSVNTKDTLCRLKGEAGEDS